MPELLIGEPVGPLKLTVGAVLFTVAVELAEESTFFVPAPLSNVLASSLMATVPSPVQPVTVTVAPAVVGLFTVAAQAATVPVVTRVIPEPLPFVRVVEAASEKVSVKLVVPELLIGEEDGPAKLTVGATVFNVKVVESEQTVFPYSSRSCTLRV